MHLISIVLILYMMDFTYTKKCKVDESKIENEKQFSHIRWSRNNPVEISDGTILVDELASCVFTCKTNPYRCIFLFQNCLTSMFRHTVNPQKVVRLSFPTLVSLVRLSFKVLCKL